MVRLAIFFGSLLAFLVSSSPLKATSLREIWGDLLKKYKPAPEKKTRPRTLAEIWGPLLAKYPYPGQIMRKKRLTEKDLARIPTFYQRRWHPARPELLRRKLSPYQTYILEASRRFRVPASVIAGVIIQESGGNPRARARDTSAKGLMQTIDATFALARRELARQGIVIRDPFNPRDSILAGTWYLSYCFDLVAQEHPGLSRERPEDWARALECYYAGPVWGRNPRPIVYIERRGKTVVIHKARYAERVLTYARVLGDIG